MNTDKKQTKRVIPVESEPVFDREAQTESEAHASGSMTLRVYQ